MIGVKVLEERKSLINGKVQAIRSLGLGTYIQVEGLTQSGGVVESIWEKVLKKLRNEEIKKCLILGLGGGTAAKLVRKFWPEAETTGVEIDPVMIELGTRYLGLDTSKIKTVIQDALDYCLLRSSKLCLLPSAFDLILVDLYVGDKFPKKFESEKFLRLTPRLITDKGIVVFNRLYFGEKRSEALRFAKKLEKVFGKVEYFYPEANLMLICQI